ncbi:MAG: InlB B-repeat-containing protein [Clostridia bacterium]|nr:InlB B-repeat-containing protein [Clostridia bacterium]
MKRIISILLALTLLATSLVAVSGCSEELLIALAGEVWDDIVEDATVGEAEGDFIYKFKDDCACIIGISEQGQQKEILIVPQYARELPVKYMGYTPFLGENYTLVSDNLKVLYIPHTLWSLLWGQCYIDVSACPNLEKIVHNTTNCAVLFVLSQDEDNTEYFNCYISGVAGIGQEEANVSFYYNYVGDGTGDVTATDEYWLDYFEDGSTIDYIPADPVRVGYTFDGWYKETECVNAWDFDNDTIVERDEPGFIEPVSFTRLCAKWTPIEDDVEP